MGCRIKLDQYLPDGASRLAHAVRSRRAELGMVREQFGRPSGTTMYSIETARKTSYDSGMMVVLERGLQWEPGSVDRILRGHSPVPTRQHDDPVEPDAVIAATGEASTQAAANRDALYRLVKTMGRIYGYHWIMDVTAEVVADLYTDKVDDRPGAGMGEDPHSNSSALSPRHEGHY